MRQTARFAALLTQPKKWLVDAWAAIDADAEAERKAHPQGAQEGARIKLLLVLAALFLALGYSFGDRPFFHERIAPRLFRDGRFSMLANHFDELCGFTFWAWAKIVGYALLPILHLKLCGERLADYGLRLQRPISPDAPSLLPWRSTYLGLFVLSFPAVLAVSTLPGFQAIYPFYRLAGRSVLDFALWEVQYLTTFFAVEFFFRGYLLFGLRRQLGSLAIFVSMVPYCMVHVLKPPAEALGSIIAGILLGTLALRTGSLWCGVLLHVSVALLMDLLAAWHGQRLPHSLWPRLF